MSQISNALKLIIIIAFGFHQIQAGVIPADTIRKKTILSVGLQQGVAINLPGRERFGGAVTAIVTGSYYYGIDVRLFIRQRLKLSLSLTSSAYAAGMEYTDSVYYANRGEGYGYGGSSTSWGEWSRYSHMPLKLGYNLNKPHRRLQICPFAQIGGLYTSNWGKTFTSKSWGTGVTKLNDTTYEEFKVAVAKPYKQALTYGAGFDVSYRFKRWVLAINAEYFRSNKIWNTMKGEYYRESQKYGTYYDKNIVDSKGASVYCGFTAYYCINGKTE